MGTPINITGTNGATVDIALTPVPILPFSKIAPADNATGLGTIVGLEWEPNAAAIRYEFCYDTIDNNSCDGTWSSHAVGVPTPRYIGVSAGVTYYWQVRAVNDGGVREANENTWWRFATLPFPAAFDKLSPPNGAVGQPRSLTLQWEESAGATEYIYCISTTLHTCPMWTSVGTARSAFISALLSSATYYWQVRARNGQGEREANGGVWWQFTTSGPPAVFSKVLPANGATLQPESVTLTWQATAGATSYRYCIDTTNDGVCDTTWMFAGTNQASISGLSPTTSYYWQVEAENGDGITPANSGSWWGFTTDGPPAGFSKLLPANDAQLQPQSLSLTWRALAGATDYRYCVDTTNNNLCDTGWISVGTALNASVSGLALSTTYYWQVEAQNGAPTPANGCTWWAFTTGRRPSAFSKIYPPNGSTVPTLSPTLSWQQSIDATAYRYCVDTTNNNSYDTAWTPVGTALSTPITGLAPSTTYFWQVEAENVYGTRSANADTWWAFTTSVPPAAFGKVLPANGATGQPLSPTLSWQASGGADSYRYCLDTSNDNSCDSSWTSVGTSSIVSPTGLTASTTYYWQVEAVNAIGATSANDGAWWAFTTASVPTSVSDAYATNFNTPLVIAAPGVLANDDSHSGGALTAALVSNVSDGTLNLAASGGFTYTPTIGFSGTDTFTYRAANSTGPGNTATVTLTVNQPPTVQAPTELYAAAIVGNLVTLRWTPASSGPLPSGYAIEGGLNPGDVLASLPTGSAYPIFTFVAPTGAFYLRVHALNGSERSVASNEIRLFVNVPQPPSAPTYLLGTVNGSSLQLSWRNTYAGGTPASLILDVTGPVIGSLPLPLGESFTFDGVPAGSYTFRVRAVNAAGASAASTAITLTFPSACSGPPLPPANFLAYRVGNTVFAVWDPADSGPAPSSFVVTSTGSFFGSIPTTGRSMSGQVPAGSYSLSVVAVNACGSIAPTPVQTVSIP